jgi:hypothetical protein
MHFSMTTATPEQIGMRLSRNEDGSCPGKAWDPNPDFQRDLVWGLKEKRFLVDSLKKRLPFGMITVIDFNSKTYIIDGKQRTSTIVSFMNGEFTDEDGLYWKDWTETERVKSGSIAIAVQEVELEESETMTDIIELFRRINTNSKQLTTGQLLSSCVNEESINFMEKVFIRPVGEDEFKEPIGELREKWAKYFCKKGFSIDGGGKTKTQITFLAGLVLPLLTGKSSSITTSFSIMYENGLRDKVTDDMKRTFFTKMKVLLSIAEKGHESGYFKNLPRGYPLYGQLSPFIHIVNIVTSEEETRHEPMLKGDLLGFLESSNFCQTFFKSLHDSDEKFSVWRNRLRKNRNIGNLNRDIRFMQGHPEDPCDSEEELEWDPVIDED